MAPKVHTVSVAEFADWHGLTSERIYQLIQQGMPHRKQSGKTRIVPKDANRWFRERAREDARRESQGDKPNEDDERARKLAAEATLKELELAERRGQLIPLVDYQERLDQFVGGLAAVAAGQLQRYERDIVRTTTAPDARRLTQQIHAALMRGAQEYAERVDAEATALEAEAESAAEVA